MVLYPPLPRPWEDTESYASELEEYEKNRQLAMFLGDLHPYNAKMLIVL